MVSVRPAVFITRAFLFPLSQKCNHKHRCLGLIFRSKAFSFGSMKIFARVLPIILSLPVIASADTLWRQYGFNAAHTSYNKAETILNKFNISRLTLFWKSETFHVPGSAPTLGFASVFVASAGRVPALNDQTGARRWSRLSCSGEGTQQPAFGQHL